MTSPGNAYIINFLEIITVFKVVMNLTIQKTKNV